MAATRAHWKNSPFKSGETLPYSACFSDAEYQRLCAGLIPVEMEDKWFVFFEKPYLYFHRSWTGHPVYRLRIEPSDNTFVVTEALWETTFAREWPERAPYEAELLDFLVSDLLLGMNKPFPLPPGVQDTHGIAQHALAGTGYAERPSASSPAASRPAESTCRIGNATVVKRPWWKRWS